MIRLPSRINFGVSFMRWLETILLVTLAASRGELKISVSNYRLPASSSKWTEVEGVIPFARKRLFNLSMLGVEAKYVRLSFRVEKEGRIAALGLYGEQSLRGFAEKQGRI